MEEALPHLRHVPPYYKGQVELERHLSRQIYRDWRSRLCKIRTRLSSSCVFLASWLPPQHCTLISPPTQMLSALRLRDEADMDVDEEPDVDMEPRGSCFALNLHLLPPGQNVLDSQTRQSRLLPTGAMAVGPFRLQTFVAQPQPRSLAPVRTVETERRE